MSHDRAMGHLVSLTRDRLCLAEIITVAVHFFYNEIYASRCLLKVCPEIDYTRGHTIRLHSCCFWWRAVDPAGHALYFSTRQPFDTHCCHMDTAIKHPVSDRVKPSFVISDIWTLWRSWLSVRVPGCHNYKWQLNPVWRCRCFICTHMVTVGVKGLNISNYVMSYKTPLVQLWPSCNLLSSLQRQRISTSLYETRIRVHCN